MRRFYNRSKRTLWRACVEFVDDRGHRDAAQIAFFAILSFVPLVMLVVAAFGLMFDDREVRERVVHAVFDNVPLGQRADRERLESGVYDALDNAGRLGPVSVLLLLAAASGVMGALRHSINQAWDIDERPPLLKRKALDLSLVLGGTLVLLFSLSQAAARETSDLLGDVMPFVFTVAVIGFLYRILPFPRPKLKEIWPGAVVAALLIELVREVLDFYFENLTDLGALYGSLGALMGLLLFVYACSLVIVFGAEVASEWSRVPAAKE